MGKLRKVLSVVLILCMLLAVVPGAMAAGKGYSDMQRAYVLSGIGGDTDVMGLAYLYGSSVDAADGYVSLMKLRSRNDALAMAMDVIGVEEFNAVLNSCIRSSQIEISNFNQLMLAEGVPDEYLSLDEKPYFVQELDKAIAAGASSLTVKDCMTVFPDALRYAASSGVNKVHFDTMNGKRVEVRITVDPAKMTKGFAPYAITTADQENSTIARMAKTYTNRFVLVDFVQDGSFGAAMRVAALADLSGLDTAKLQFYRYDFFTNKISAIEKPEYSIDEKGYLYFNTNAGGSVLITDKPLDKRSK